MFKAGTARADITPPLELELAGYPHYPRNNTGAHDPLYAACLYLSDGKTELAMVTLDLLFFSKLHVLEIRRRVETACGLSGSNLMISCSHTHSGPWASGRLDIESLEAGKEQPKEYIAVLVTKITSIVTEAKKTSFDALLTTGTAMCGAQQGVGGNRNIPGGPHDPMISVIAVKDLKDDIRGIFTNYTLHPTFIHEWSNLVTGDYPCYLRQQLEEFAPKAVVGFSQGASGNQSSRYYRKGESYDEAERVGRLLGKAAWSVVESGDFRNDLTLSTISSTIVPNIRVFDDESTIMRRVAEDKVRYEDLYARYGKSEKREEYYLWQNANLKLLGSEDQLGYVKMINQGAKIELLLDENPVEVQIMRIGNACVVGVPGEIFVEYALFVKAMAGYPMVMFNTLTNGCMPGYLVTPQAMAAGGYEADTSMIDVVFGRKLIDCILDTIANCPKIE